MSALARSVSCALALAAVVGCNAILDNPERHLASGAGASGTGATGTQGGAGGSSNGMGGNASGAGGRGGGSGGSDTAGDTALGGSSARGGTGGGGNVGGGTSGDSTGGSVTAGEAGVSDGSGGSSMQGGTGGTGGSGGGGGTAGSPPIHDSMGVPLAKAGESKSGSGEFLNLGDMRLLNDRTGSLEQGCEATTGVYTNTDSGVGWSFARPDCTGDGAPDFLGLEFGIHPFPVDSDRTAAPDYSSTALMPLQIKNITSASVSVDSFGVTTSSGSATLGFRLWLSQRSPVADPSDPGVFLELSVLWGWTLRGVCSQAATVLSGADAYDLCASDDSYGWQGGTWRYREFRLENGGGSPFSGTLDVKKFTDWLVATGYSQDFWVTRFEIGTEVGVDTTGQALLNDATFEVNGSSRSIQIAE